MANSRDNADKAAESFLSGSTHQKLFAKTFVRNKSPAPATQPRRSMKRAPEEKSLASPAKSVRACPDTLLGMKVTRLPNCLVAKSFGRDLAS